MSATELESQYSKLYQEFEEYRKESRELENELAREVEQRDKLIEDLTIKNAKLNAEKEDFVNKYRMKIKEMEASHETGLAIQKSLTENNEKFGQKVVELEQIVDNLETNLRIKESSLKDLDEKVNSLLERNALLELEVENSRSLVDQIQRLKDELKEAKDDLLAKSKQHISIPAVTYSNSIDSESPTMSPLQIVKDMTSKIRNLEAKLSSCRQLISSSNSDCV